jgi:uncharacterized protein (DUF169 family)
VENVGEIQRIVGAAWTGVKFYFDEATVPDISAGRGLRFCEAVLKARSRSLLLTPDVVTCVGARYAFGWDADCRDEIIHEVRKRRGIGHDVAEAIVSQVPGFEEAPCAIGLNCEEVPDLIISYCQPTTVMEFLKVWQADRGGRNPTCSLSSVLSVCGNVAVGCYLSRQVSMSFGCEDARESANISRDRLVIGIPYRLIKQIVGRRSQT